MCRPTADEVAEIADRGHDISRFFTNQGEMKQPLASIRVDITQAMLQELDQLPPICMSAARQPSTPVCAALWTSTSWPNAENDDHQPTVQRQTPG